MKSTGEVMGKDKTMEKALYKGLVASGMEIQKYGTVLITVADKDKEEAWKLQNDFLRSATELSLQEGRPLLEAGIQVEVL